MIERRIKRPAQESKKRISRRAEGSKRKGGRRGGKNWVIDLGK